MLLKKLRKYFAPKKILILTGESVPGHEWRNVELCLALQKKGFLVKHVGPHEELQKTGFKTTTFNDEKLAQEKGIELFKTWNEIYTEIPKFDVLILSLVKNYDKVVSLAKEHQLLTIGHIDHGSLDQVNYDLDLYLVRNSWDKEWYSKGVGIDEQKIKVCGSTFYDDLLKQERLDKKSLCEKYNLNPDKKIALFLTNSPACHSEQIKSLYQSIIRAVENAENWQVLVKPHPREYAGTKMNVCYQDVKTPTWVQLFPDTPAVSVEDKGSAYAHADLVLTNMSSSFFELAIYRQSIVFVDTLKWFFFGSNREFSQDEFAMKKLMTKKLGVHELSQLGEKEVYEKLSWNLEEMQFIEERIQFERKYFSHQPPRWVGISSLTSDLEEILNRYKEIHNQSGVIFSNYCKEYHPFLGKAVERLSEEIALKVN